MSEIKFIVLGRKPQRRIYNGCNYSEEIQWSSWKELTYHRTKESAQGTIDAFKK